MKKPTDVNPLTQTLEEEKAADEKLTELGMNIVKLDALEEEDMEQERA